MNNSNCALFNLLPLRYEPYIVSLWCKQRQIRCEVLNYTPCTMFEVVSTRSVDAPGEKKHVAYSILVQTINDVTPVVIERRYTDFFELYNNLRRDNQTLISRISLPKKVIIGNFAPNLIATRSNSFSSLLQAITECERLRESSCLRWFLIGSDEKEAIQYMKLKQYHSARPILLHIFSLLNKIYTDRHPAVLVALCRLATCCCADPSALLDAEKYGELALRRFETVSDIDLLPLYVPLLQMCVHLWWTLGRDKNLLEARLSDMRRQGHRVDGCPSLWDAVLNDEYLTKCNRG